MSRAEDTQPVGPRFESAEAFLTWVESQPARYELIDGVARMMTGGSLNQGRLSRNVLAALAGRLGTGPCEAFGSDVAIILGSQRVVFPDASVSCEAEDEAGIAHPVVIVEVLSPSTASYDMGDKASRYRRMPSLRHLVLIRQDRIDVQHFHRNAEYQEFSLTEIGTVDGLLRLDANGVDIPISELYAQVTFAG